MGKNYFKVAIRYLLRHKAFTIINVFGLATGVTICMLIMLFVKSEWSFDKFNSHAEKIYRVWLEEKEAADKIFTSTVTPLPMGNALVEKVPEIEKACRVYTMNVGMNTGMNPSAMQSMTIVDKTFFDMFDFKISEGNTSNPFPSENSIILTKRSAKKLFGNVNAAGQIIYLKIGEDKIPFVVSAIAEDPPVESSVRFEALISFENEKKFWNESQSHAWHEIYPETYVLLKEKADIKTVENKMESFAKSVLADTYRQGTYMVNFQNITDIHLNDAMPEGIQPVSSPTYSYILATIGFLILLIACINFITLSVSRSTTRAMEVGVRKVLGAVRKQLMQQFWTEALIFTIVSVLTGLIFAFILCRPFSDLFQRELHFHFDTTMILFCTSIIIFIAFVAGMYPALLLSGFNAVEIFKKKTITAKNKGWLRHSLMTIQFMASITLIICMITISRQLQFLQNKDLGYKKSQMIIVSTNKGGEEGSKIANLFKVKIDKLSQVKSSAVSLYSFAEDRWINMGYTDKDQRYRTFMMNEIDADFIPTMKIKIIAGRNFLKDNSADVSTGMIVNKALVDEYKWKDPVGMMLPGRTTLRVIGVVDDFNYESLHSKVSPLVLVMNADSLHVNDVSVQYSPNPRITIDMEGGSISNNIEKLAAVWKSIDPNRTFDYKFLDDSIASQYSSEERIRKIVMLASGLSIFIACIGLFGLSSLMVSRRIKEIGIRKILGAKISSILTLISREFIIVVSIASLISFPVAFFAMNKWLNGFAFRIEFKWWFLPLSAILALLLTIITVGIQAMKAAISNPVNSIRTE